jgi:hypothetical protein
METCACAGELVNVPVRINSSGAARTGAKFIASSFAVATSLYHLMVATHAIRFGSWKAICFGRGSRSAWPSAARCKRPTGAEESTEEPTVRPYHAGCRTNAAYSNLAMDVRFLSKGTNVSAVFAFQAMNR